MDEQKQRICLDYETFGECVNGDRCRDKHVTMPHPTRSVMATVVKIAYNTFEVMTTYRGTDSYQKYFIPSGYWYRAGVRHGDFVKLQISEMFDPRTEFCFARILKVGCRSFDIFRDCKYGQNCKSEHFENDQESQYFYVAKVVSIIKTAFNQSCELEVDLQREDRIQRQTLYVPYSDFWHLKDAVSGNLVIIQESSRIHRRKDIKWNFGRVIAILHDSQEIEETHIPLEKKVRKGFAVKDLSYGRHQAIAFVYSTEECRHHNQCRRIGLHILAAALGDHFNKRDEDLKHRHQVNRSKCIDKGFVGYSIRIAISLYVHSTDETIDGPMLTPVLLPSDHIIDFVGGADIRSEDFESMWKAFGEDALMEDAANTRVASYMVDSPKIWKTNYLIHYKMKNFANKHLSKYLRRSKSKVCSIARITFPDVRLPEEQVAIPEEFAETATQRLPSGERNWALVALLGFANRCASNFYEEYIYDAIPCNELPCDETKSVIMTSPFGQTTDYVNQQILLSQMISPGTQLYSKSELLGIPVRRFDRPNMYEMMVTQILTDATIDLHICGVSGRRKGNQKFPIDQIFKGAICVDTIVNERKDTDETGSSTMTADSIRFTLKGLACDDYCNTKLTLLPADKLMQLNKAMNGKDDQTVEERIKDLDVSKIALDAPYQKADNGTKVILYRGVTLQLQFSKNSFTDDEDFLSLLKIGKGCHLCLVHLSSTQFAFKNKRVDAHLLVTKTLIAKAEDDIAQNRLKTIVLKEMNIQWNDAYFSGGTFNTHSKITASNLLCIRKEISETDKRQPFVWICHGVVDEVCEDRVRFLVCNLHQDQTRDLFKGKDNNFVIEVIDVTTQDED